MYVLNQEVLVALALQLKRHQQTLSTAESCTGGWIAKALTDAPGSSRYFVGGIVSYSNEMKHRLLGVEKDTLKRYGAVSQSVVEQMAEGGLGAMAADYTIAVSGIAGPDGGSHDKPVGTVWFAVACKSGRRVAQKQQFSGDRETIRLACVNYGLELVRQNLDEPE